MIKPYAIILDGIVENVIMIDSDDNDAISLFNAVEIPDDLKVCIGWPYLDNTFIDPNPPVDTEPNYETIVPITDEEIQQMLAELQNEITPTP